MSGHVVRVCATCSNCQYTAASTHTLSKIPNNQPPNQPATLPATHKPLICSNTRTKQHRRLVVSSITCNRPLPPTAACLLPASHCPPNPLAPTPHHLHPLPHAAAAAAAVPRSLRLLLSPSLRAAGTSCRSAAGLGAGAPTDPLGLLLQACGWVVGGKVEGK